MLNAYNACSVIIIQKWKMVMIRTKHFGHLPYSDDNYKIKATHIASSNYKGKKENNLINSINYY